ncbi:MAG: cell division protein ZapA [Clostridiales bacterium]|nr:cell division protein ZapA [Clostridiales bacterium]
MEYRSNSGNLFKKYSTLTGGQKDRPEEPITESKDNLVEYNQRYKADATPAIPPKELTKNSKVIVHIGGMQHMLSAPDHDGEAYIRSVAEKADRIVESIRAENPGMSMTNVLTLALVNAVDQLNHSEKLRLDRDTAIEEMLVRTEAVKDDYLKQREINWELKKEVLRLKDLMQTQDREEAVYAEEEESKLPLEELISLSETEDFDEDS